MCEADAQELNSGETDATQSEPIAMLLIKGRDTFFSRLEQGDMRNQKTRTVDIAFRSLKHLADATRGIDPAGEAIIGTADEGDVIFNGAKDSGCGVLPLSGTFAEPSVVGEVDEEIGIGKSVVASQVWEYVFEANEDGDIDAEVGHLERDHAVTGRKAAGDGGQIFDKRQPADEGNIFAEDDEVAFFVAFDQPTFGTDEEAAVEKVGFIFRGGSRARFGIIGADDHPDLMFLSETGNGFESVLVETE